jgi:hypothetical protein
MKRFLIFACVITALGCSSTGNIKIVSPSTSEKEAKEEISKAPVTRLETFSSPEAATRRKQPAAESSKIEARQGAENTIKIVSPSVPENEAKEEIAKAPVKRPETAPPATSEHSLEALINLLEKKGIIKNEELLREIRELEKKRQ